MGSTTLHRLTHILVVISVVLGKGMHCYLEQYWAILHKTWEAPAKHKRAVKNTAEQQLLAVCFQQWWKHGSSEVQWMLTAGHCSTSKGDRVSDTGVSLCPTCWPVKTCWGLKFCDNVKNRLSHKEEEKSNLGCWRSFFSKLFPGF